MVEIKLIWSRSRRYIWGRSRTTLLASYICCFNRDFCEGHEPV